MAAVAARNVSGSRARKRREAGMLNCSFALAANVHA